MTDKIIDLCCEHFEVLKSDLLSKKRHRHIAECRMVVMSLLKKETELTLKGIGSVLDRDHSTIIYGIDTCDNTLIHDVRISQKIHNIKSELRETNFKYSLEKGFYV